MFMKIKVEAKKDGPGQNHGLAQNPDLDTLSQIQGTGLDLAVNAQSRAHGLILEND